MTTDGIVPPPEALERWRDRGLVAFLLAAAFVNYLTWRGYVFEDAFITYRYAANLAAGEGFVFQPGERVLGTSTPLYTLLLAAFGFLGADIPTAGRLLFSFALSACALFGWRLLARRGAGNAGVVFAVAVASGAGGILPFFGMETALHLALTFLAFLLADGRRPVVLGVVLGLLCLNRYDGVMAVAAILLFRFFESRRPPWREALACGAIFGSWLLFAWRYFGSPLPNSYVAKAADVSFSDYLFASLDQQARMFLLPLNWIAPITARPAFVAAAMLVLLLPLAWRGVKMLAALPRLPRTGDLAPPALFALFLWLGYSCIGPPLGHAWYLIPASYSLLALALAAWSRLPMPATAARKAALLLLLASSLLLPYTHQVQSATYSTVAFGSARIRAYENFATWVRRHGFQNTSVLTLEPGYLTYLSGQRAIDAAGLVSPGIFSHGPQERRQDFFALLNRLRPEMAITFSPLGHEKAAEENYLPGLTPAPGFNLWMRRDFFAGQLGKLYEAWQNGAYGVAPENAAAIRRHPLDVDFLDLGVRPFFSLRRSRLQKVPGLTFAGEPYRQRVLNSRGGVREAAAWSDPFLIDFDQLEFLYAGSHSSETVAQLYVEGLLAAEVGGRTTLEGPPAVAPLEKVGLPVYGWRGHLAKLVFVTTDARKYFFAADQIRSRRFSSQHCFDDFESGAYDPLVWAETFAATPLGTQKLAAAGGLPMAQGHFAAASLFETGAQRMISRPFRIGHQRMSFAFYDFGNQETRAELEVDGQAVHRHSGRGQGKIDLVQWDLAQLQGKMAVLKLLDGAAAAEIGIGIDSILLYDE